MNQTCTLDVPVSKGKIIIIVYAGFKKRLNWGRVNISKHFKTILLDYHEDQINTWSTFKNAL